MMKKADEDLQDFDAAEFMQDVANDLQQRLTPFYQSLTEINIRCPFCGDSHNASSAHLYISKAFPFPWNCFRCPEQKGYLNTELIDLLGVHDSDIRVTVRNLERHASSFKTLYDKKLTKVTDIRHRKRLVIPPPTKDDIPKLKYINQRLGRTISRADIERYKIVLNLDTFLTANNINISTCPDHEYIRFANECYGNLSFDESNITFRSIDPAVTSKKYRLYNLFKSTSEEKASKIFTVRKEIDITLPKYHIVVAEGTLDLMQIEMLFYADVMHNPNYLAGSVQGKDLAGMVKSIVALGLFPAEIDIYADNEPGMVEELQKTISRLPFKASEFFKVNIYTNNMLTVPKGQKQDFGIPAEMVRRVSITI